MPRCGACNAPPCHVPSAGRPYPAAFAHTRTRRSRFSSSSRLRRWWASSPSPSSPPAAPICWSSAAAGPAPPPLPPPSLPESLSPRSNPSSPSSSPAVSWMAGCWRREAVLSGCCGGRGDGPSLCGCVVHPDPRRRPCTLAPPARHDKHSPRLQPRPPRTSHQAVAGRVEVQAGRGAQAGCIIVHVAGVVGRLPVVLRGGQQRPRRGRHHACGGQAHRIGAREAGWDGRREAALGGWGAGRACAAHACDACRSARPRHFMHPRQPSTLTHDALLVANFGRGRRIDWHGARHCTWEQGGVARRQTSTRAPGPARPPPTTRPALGHRPAHRCMGLSGPLALRATGALTRVPRAGLLALGHLAPVVALQGCQRDGAVALLVRRRAGRRLAPFPVASPAAAAAPAPAIRGRRHHAARRCREERGEGEGRGGVLW